MDSARTEHLFSYGTLQLAAVQWMVFGRKLEGRPDSLGGYKTTWLKIRDPEVVRLSGKSFYPMLTPAVARAKPVAGTVFKVTSRELQLADGYEVPGHLLVHVTLTSGTSAWVFVHP